MAARFDCYWQCDASMPDHPKTIRFASILNVSIVHAMGLLAVFFCRVTRHSPSGDMNGITTAVIGMWTGTDGKATLDALIEAGWVDAPEAGDDGVLLVHGWGERYEKVEARRERDAERQRNRRTKGRFADSDPAAPPAERPDDVTRTSRGRPSDVHAASRGRPGEDEDEDVKNDGGMSGGPATPPACGQPVDNSVPAPPNDRRRRIFRSFEEVTNGEKNGAVAAARLSDRLLANLGPDATDRPDLTDHADATAFALTEQARAKNPENPAKYVAGNVSAPWVRNLAAGIQAEEAIERDKAERRARGVKPRSDDAEKGHRTRPPAPPTPSTGSSGPVPARNGQNATSAKETQAAGLAATVAAVMAETVKGDAPAAPARPP